MRISLLLALASLVAWIALVFIAPVQAGIVHVLLAIGTTLLVRWWGEAG